MKYSATARGYLLPLFFPVLTALLVLALVLGAEPIPLSALFDFKNRDPFYTILLFDIRLPRSVCAMLTGALLAGSGAVFQGFFRNGLADPAIMGVSSGAALGAVLSTFVISAGTGFFWGRVSVLGFFAFCGALLAVAIAYAASGASRSVSGSAALLLAGTALSAFFSAITSVLLLLRDKELHKMYVWTLGSFNGRGWNEVFVMLFPALISCALFFLCARPLDVLSAGELGAQALGLDVKKWQPLIICAGALGTASAVSSAGTIGFIGLIAPHIARFLFGPSHRVLIAASMCTGAGLLLLSDIAARTVAIPAEIPVGIITALLGTPFFLYILLKKGYARD